MKKGLHIGFIMDGNRRWAKAHGFSLFEGYKKGFYVLKDIVFFVLKNKELNVRYISAYAFSKDNWKRDIQQVNLLMSLIYEYLHREKDNLQKGKVRLKLIGDVNGLSKNLRESFFKMEEVTKYNENLTLLIAVNYSGRDEIIYGVKHILSDFKEGKIAINDINEEIFSKYLYLYPFPDVDILVRTSHANRLSDFFLWHAAYTEFYFLNKYWPDFTLKDLQDILKDYNNKPKRFGK